jgi:succinate dehydrogenase/fumarate reductase-like Fe-S protein
MTKFNAINNTKILTLTGIFAVFAVAMVTGPLALNMGDNTAFAKSNHKDNDADQSTEQGQYSDQNSQCVSGESIVLSCNNLSLKEQANDGHHASGQQGGDRGSSNDADQSTEQEQKSRQNSQCVSGESIVLSCNNLSLKEQANDGNSASGQQGGDRGSSNDADQSTEQEQDSDQNAQCVSGEDAIVSCNNAEFQNLVNSGNRALAQD